MPHEHVVLVEWTRTAAVGRGFVLALFEHLALTEQLSPWRSSSVVTFAIFLAAGFRASQGVGGRPVAARAPVRSR